MNIIIWELILVAVVALGLGGWQLYDVNRALRKHRDENAHAGTNPRDDANQAPNQELEKSPGDEPR